MTIEVKNLNEPNNPQLNIRTISGSSYSIGVMCDVCFGDGWLYQSKGGQSGLIKNCLKCDGKGFLKITSNRRTNNG